MNTYPEIDSDPLGVSKFRITIPSTAHEGDVDHWLFDNFSKAIVAFNALKTFDPEMEKWQEHLETWERL